MENILELKDKIINQISKIEEKFEKLAQQNIDLIEANENLLKQNAEIKKECHKALSDIDICIKKIELIEENGKA